jgi:Zn-dependent protease with chaperone function/Zn-finger nucleic acid-binding protein
MSVPPRDFYEIQERQRAKSVLLFGAVLVFHFIALGTIGLSLLLVVGIFAGGLFGSAHFWSRFLLIDFGAATLVAALHFLDARRNGPRMILRRLQAATPDPTDRYHKQFLDTVDEIRIAAGLPRVNAYVLPSFAINSLALIEEDGTPAVAVTEGLLAEGTRDELEAFAAHEIAHIARGDAFTLTLVCSLATLFERLREALEPEQEEISGSGGERGAGAAVGGAPFLLYLAATLSALVMHLLSTLVSRERELLADAAAVELCRAPDSLARAIYKAHVKNSFVGDFSLTYTPLFIVPPDSRDISDGRLAGVFNSHPPLMKRLGLLAAMAHKTPAEIIAEVREGEGTRRRARGVLHSFEEVRRGQMELFPDGEPSPSPELASAGGAATVTAGTPASPLAAPAGPGSPGSAGVGAAGTPCPELVSLPVDGSRIWLLAAPGPAHWEGPFTMSELLCRPRFSLLMNVKNLQEGVEAKSREFPQVRAALRNLALKKPIEPGRENRCPRCRVPLIHTFYEGVPVGVCPDCRGKLVDMASVDKIVARREVAFSESLTAKARAFEEKVLLNPVKNQKITDLPADRLPCPNCGYRMVPRPYNYQYFVPVDKCLSCSKIWFDSDELEILQILIEERRPDRAAL